MSYNHNRPYEQREVTPSELSQKQVNKDAAKYVVVTTRDAADGCFNGHNPFGNQITTSTLSASLRAWAQHYSDTAITSAGSSKPRSSLRRWMSDEV